MSKFTVYLFNQNHRLIERIFTDEKPKVLELEKSYKDNEDVRSIEIHNKNSDFVKRSYRWGNEWKNGKPPKVKLTKWHRSEYTKNKATVITFSPHGHAIESESGGRLSGYENPESFLIAVKNGEYHAYNLEGAFVRDDREAIEKDPALALRQPLIGKAFKEAEKLNEFTSVIAANYGLAGVCLLKDHVRTETPNPNDLDSIGGMDEVTPEVYMAWWRKFGVPKGAKLGKFTKGEIVWE